MLVSFVPRPPATMTFPLFSLVAVCPLLRGAVMLTVGAQVAGPSRDPRGLTATRKLLMPDSPVWVVGARSLSRGGRRRAAPCSRPR